MRFICTSILFSLLILTGQILNGANVAEFAGVWIHNDAEISRLEILTTAEGVYVHAWNKDDSLENDLGLVEAQILHRAAQGKNATTLSATFKMDHRPLMILLNHCEEGLEVKLIGVQTFKNTDGLYVFNKMVEADLAPKSIGCIRGKATGMAKSTSSIFNLTLYGPDDPNQLQSVQAFGLDRTYDFSNLPDGRYWLIVDSPAMTGIQAFPQVKEFSIENGSAFTQNVELK